MVKRNLIYGPAFMALGATLLLLGWDRRDHWDSLLALSAGICFSALGVGYTLSWPGLFGKTREGHLLLSSYVLFWPYHLINYASILLFRLLVRERPFHEIVPGLFLGGRLLPWEARLFLSRPAAVLDLTCEFSEVGFLRGPQYRCIPLLDGTAPSRAELELGLAFIRERLREGPVYVHCAMGHGRSATYVIAHLVCTGAVPGLAEAVALVRARRPGVKLKRGQMECLRTLKI